MQALTKLRTAQKTVKHVFSYAISVVVVHKTPHGLRGTM